MIALPLSMKSSDSSNTHLCSLKGAHLPLVTVFFCAVWYTKGMKKLGRVLGCILVVLVVVLAVGITLTIGWRPFIGPRARGLTGKRYESTPARLVRGEYLVNAVTYC